MTKYHNKILCTIYMYCKPALAYLFLLIISLTHSDSHHYPSSPPMRHMQSYHHASSPHTPAINEVNIQHGKQTCYHDAHFHLLIQLLLFLHLVATPLSIRDHTPPPDPMHQVQVEEEHGLARELLPSWAVLALVLSLTMLVHPVLGQVKLLVKHHLALFAKEDGQVQVMDGHVLLLQRSQEPS